MVLQPRYIVDRAPCRVVEGACRHLVKDRMEGTRMRWWIEGAQAMLDLRAVYLNDEWERFQQFRIDQERDRLYPYRHGSTKMAQSRKIPDRPHRKLSAREEWSKP